MAEFPRTPHAELGWDSYSRFWEEHVKSDQVRVLGEEWFAPGEVAAIWTAFGAPHVGPGVDAVEIGCGGGKWSRMLAPRVRSYTAADVSAEMLARTRALLGDGSSNRYVKLDGIDWRPLLDGAFDLLWTFDVLVHFDMEDLWGALRETRRVLRPGGVAVVHVADLLSDEGFAQFAREAPANRGSDKLFCRLRYYSDDVMRRLVEGAGLAVAGSNLVAGRKTHAPRDLVYVLRPR